MAKVGLLVGIPDKVGDPMRLTCTLGPELPKLLTQ